MNRKTPYCTIALIAANVIIFFMLSMKGMTEDTEYMMAHGAMYVPDLLYRGQYQELFTSMFLHFGFDHLMSNMISLAVMGAVLEQEAGSIRFVIIYLISGLCGNALSAVMDFYSAHFSVSAGASGAIFGIIGALLYLAVKNHGRVGNVTRRGILIMLGLSLYMGITSTGIDNFAHLGGLLAGFILSLILCRHVGGRRQRYDDYGGYIRSA